MRMTNQAGELVEADAAPPTLSGDAIARQRDLHMLAFSLAGLGYRRIGVYFGVSAMTVSRRINAIPPRARDYYARRLFRGGLPTLEAAE